MYPDYNMYNQYYGFNDFNYRNYQMPTQMPNQMSSQMPNDEMISLNQAIVLIKQSINDEKCDEAFYDELIKKATTEKEKNIIRSIRNDERRHNQILRSLYYRFTGQMIPMQDCSMPETNNVSATYSELLEKALFNELEAVIKYRKILSAMPDDESYSMIMAIMIDELTHANKYNFLIHKAK